MLSPKYILVETEVIFVTGGQCIERKAVSEGQDCSFWKGLRCLHKCGHGIHVCHVCTSLVSVVEQRWFTHIAGPFARVKSSVFSSWSNRGASIYRIVQSKREAHPSLPRLYFGLLYRPHPTLRWEQCSAIDDMRRNWSWSLGPFCTGKPLQNKARVWI